MKFRNAVIVAVVACATIAGCAKHRAVLTPEARAYTEVPPAEAGVVETPDKMDPLVPAFSPLTAAGGSSLVTAPFRGVDRKGAKTSISTADREEFNDVGALLDSLTPDDDMLNHSPAIDRQTMTRADEEQRNVRVPAWMYAIKFEADDDWHVIIGTDPNGGARRFFNAEISGLPAKTSDAYKTLAAVRQALADLLGDSLPSTDSYRKFKQPIAVMFEGSLFFDVDHAAGVVGPQGMRPETAWEIHPVTRLTPVTR